jgi:hypothetical protein
MIVAYKRWPMKPPYEQLLATLESLLAEIEATSFDGMHYEYFAGKELIEEARDVVKRASA